jgi:hypothetical protein
MNRTHTRREGVTGMHERLIAALAVAAALLGLAAPAAASTASTWTITPGGDITGRSGIIALTDTSTGTALQCESSTIGATLNSGRHQANPIGEVTSVTFASCDGPGGQTFRVTATTSPARPWPVTASTHRGRVTRGTIGNITLDIAGTGCRAAVGGTTAGSPGTAGFRFINVEDALEIGGGTLHAEDVTGCAGLFAGGDPVTWTGGYKVLPPQTVTSP